MSGRGRKARQAASKQNPPSSAADQRPPSLFSAAPSGMSSGSSMGSGNPAASGASGGAPAARSTFSASYSPIGEASASAPVSEFGRMDITGDTGAFKTVETYKFNNYAKSLYGTEGKKSILRTNYFKMTVAPLKLYHYNIEITPLSAREGEDTAKKDVKRKKIPKEVNFLVFDQLLRTCDDFPGQPVFDGEKNVYTARSEIRNYPLYERVFESVTIVENGRERMFKVRFTKPDDSFCLDLTNINKISVTDFKSSEVQALDIILKNGPRRVKVNVGFNLFKRCSEIQRMNDDNFYRVNKYLGDLKWLRYGFYQSARMTEGGLMLNVDRAAIVFNEGGRLLDLIKKYGKYAKHDPIDNHEINYLIDGVEKEIKTLKVQIEHISYKPKFGIHMFTKKPISELFFEDEQKKKVSVYDYFNNKHQDWFKKNNITLNKKLRCVQVGRERPKYFPLEVCTLVDDQHSLKKLKAKLQSDMTRHAGSQNPMERFSEIESNLNEIIRDNQRNNYDSLNEFGIKLDKTFIEVESRILDAPKLMYQKEFLLRSPGQWDMGKSGLIYKNPAQLDGNYVAINITTRNKNKMILGCHEKSMEDFLREFGIIGRQLGMQIKAPCAPVKNIFYSRGDPQFKEKLEKIMKDYPNVKLIIAFIPKEGDVYHELKKICDLDLGVATQCIAQENQSKMCTGPFVSNILLKVNTKVHGVNVTVAPSSLPQVLRQPTMIVGLDVTHPAPADKLSQSIAAVVASYDKFFYKYFARIVIQPKPKKEIVDLARVMRELLQEFKRINKIYPSQVIIFRDGVSEGQFDEVMVKEQGMLKNCFKDLEINPKIIFIVVQKRNHTRFLNYKEPARTHKGGLNYNPLPGTVVDRKITSNVLWDFYIVPHLGMIGTSRPIHFYVLYDELKMSADDVQKITYYLCHTFPRCTRSVSCPAPVLYAHLSAARARSHIYILDESDGSSTIISGSGTKECPQLSAAEIRDKNEKLKVPEALQGILYYL